MTYPETITLRKTSRPRHFCVSLCGPRTKKLGDPWHRILQTIIIDQWLPKWAVKCNYSGGHAEPTENDANRSVIVKFFCEVVLHV